MRRLGVNIDHVATLREVRQARYPDPIAAAQEAVRAGADQITVHLREDRRHIQDRDVITLKRVLDVPLNLEMAATSEMQRFALKVRPSTVTLVPERRQELTTEGGLDLMKSRRRIAPLVEVLRKRGIRTSAFIAACPDQVGAASELGFDAVEFHTGDYCERHDAARSFKRALADLKTASALARAQHLLVFAGHGINESNLPPLLQIPEIEEYNIGHSLIAMAVTTGLYEAVRRMKKSLNAR